MDASIMPAVLATTRMWLRTSSNSLQSSINTQGGIIALEHRSMAAVWMGYTDLDADSSRTFNVGTRPLTRSSNDGVHRAGPLSGRPYSDPPEFPQVSSRPRVMLTARIPTSRRT